MIKHIVAGIITGVLITMPASAAPSITRPQKVIMELDPNDQGTLKFHCHSHSTTASGTVIYTHCKRGL